VVCHIHFVGRQSRVVLDGAQVLGFAIGVIVQHGNGMPIAQQPLN